MGNTKVINIMKTIAVILVFMLVLSGCRARDNQVKDEESKTISENNDSTENSELTITVTWIIEDQDGTRYHVDAWLESADGSSNVYDHISSESREGQQIITLYDLQGSYNLALASMEEGEAPMGYFGVPGVDVEIRLPDQDAPVTFTQEREHQENMFRAQTGVWIWRPCSIHAGHVEEYKPF